MDNSKTVITGATGWLGSELSRILVEEHNLSTRQLYFISSANRKKKIGKKTFTTITFRDLDNIEDTENYYDFAFLPRHNIDSIGPKKYREVNEKIIMDSVNLINVLRPKNIVLASSGAVYKTGKISEDSNNSLYSDLKIFQEEKIQEVCSKVNSNLITIRIFNLSGNGMPRENTFALSQIIREALNNQKIFIKSNFRVNRSYCDVTQLLRMLVSASNSGYIGTLDSSGIKIEIRDLAEKVVNELKSLSKIHAPDVVSGALPDNYFSESKKYDDLLREYLGEKTLSIKEQIHKTKNALNNTNSN
jgi:nucleoside-diphosphate-sugar epimerase